MPTVSQRYGRTAGRTDRQTDGRLTIAIPRFALRASRGKTDLRVTVWPVLTVFLPFFLKAYRVFGIFYRVRFS